MILVAPATAAATVAAPATAVTTAATTAATAAAVLARAGLIDSQAAALDVLASERGDRGLSLGVAAHLDEAEPLGSTRVPVHDHLRRLVMARLARLDADRATGYTMFILNAVSESVRQALEALMPVNTFGLHNEVVDRFLAQGEAKGRADSLLRVLSRRGLRIPDEMRQRVLACTDNGQLETWIDRAVTAATVQDVFG